jgi:hypothetical protein
MARVVVTVHHRTHTTPGDPEPHPWDTHRTVVARTAGGPCLAPVTITAGPRTVQVDCHRARRSDQQCDACRVELVVQAVTATFTGPYRIPDRTVPTGLAEHPCQICGQPLAATLAGLGRHILCGRSSW